MKRDISRARPLWWSISLLWAAMVALMALAALGLDGLPKENGKTGTPWYGFLAVAGFGLLLVFVGGHGAATRHTTSAADDREFIGGKAVLIGGLQCVAGGAAIGFAIYGLAFCESW